MNYQAVYDKLIVEIIQHANTKTTKSGILLPEGPAPAFSRGKIVSKGEGTYMSGLRVPMDVEVGDEILYNPNMVFPIELSEDNDFVIMSDRDVVAIIKKGDA